MHGQYPAGAGGSNQAVLADGPRQGLFLPYGAQFPVKPGHQRAVAFRPRFLSGRLFFLRKLPDAEGKLRIRLPVILLHLLADAQVFPLVVVCDGHRGVFLTQDAVPAVSLAYPVVAERLCRLFCPERISQKSRH